MSLTVLQNISLPSEQLDLLKKTIAYEQASLAANTRRTYASMWRKFESWCHANNLSSLPASAETISLYLGSLGGSVSFSTIDSVIAAIEKAHKNKGVQISGSSELYRRVRKGIRRAHKEKQSFKQAKALSIVELLLFCRQLSHNIIDLRDKVIITTGFFGGLRRSEIIGLDVNHVEFTDKGVILHLLQTKTSDEVEHVFLGKTKDASICPCNALQEWIQAAQPMTGPLIRSFIKGGKISDKRLTSHAISVLMKQYFGDEYSGHSLRRGLITALAEKGIPIHKIQQHSRHKSADMVIRYIEKVDGFDNAASNALGI
jgi:integrase